MNRKYVAYSLMFGSAFFAIISLCGAQVDASQEQPNRVSQHSSNRRSHDNEEEGQRIFEQNCARCHNAPDGFSPRITGTIVRHMRVRANLSRHDEEILLHYFTQ